MKLNSNQREIVCDGSFWLGLMVPVNNVMAIRNLKIKHMISKQLGPIAFISEIRIRVYLLANKMLKASLLCTFAFYGLQKYFF